MCCTTSIIEKMNKGDRHNMLTAVRFSRRDKHRRSYWIFKCDCGNEKEMRTDIFCRSNCYSCGCYNRTKKSNYRHGHSPVGGTDRTYKSWQMMKTRCTNLNYNHYKNYGGRGISFCEEWNKFENFLEDMGERPEHKSLDRINNEGNYEKQNCKWSTRTEQNNNTRRQAN